MSNIPCYYHPTSNAADKCELCGKIICRECVKVYIKIKSDYSEKYNYCPICYHKTTINSTRERKTLYSYIILILIIVYLLLFFFDYPFPFNISDSGFPPIIVKFFELGSLIFLVASIFIILFGLFFCQP